MTGLHVHVGPRPVVPHGLALGHVHLALGWDALGRRDGVIVTAHRAVAAGGHIHRATGHVWGLVGARTGTLHGHVIRPWKTTHTIRDLTLKTMISSTETCVQLPSHYHIW